MAATSVSVTPEEIHCPEYADYLFKNYASHHSKFHSEMWAEIGEKGATYSNIKCGYDNYMANGRCHAREICSFE